MGKAKKRSKGGADSDAERTRIVKVRVTGTEVADIRVAAALKDLPVSEFVREAALQVARQVISGRYSGGR